MAKKSSKNAVKVQPTPSTTKVSPKSIEDVLALIRKDHGADSIMRMGERPQNIEAISSGCLSLDMALGVMGYPKGRIIEFFGPESSGKSTLALHAVAQAQKAGGIAAYIDAEHALNPQWAEGLGVDINSLLISQPASGEESLNICSKLVEMGIDMVVIDSVAALVPQVELDGQIGDTHVGLQARMMSQAMRTLAAKAGKSGTTIIFINQLREKIGVMFGSPETTPGGRALKFYSSVRVDIRRIGQIKEGTVIVGARTKAKVVKNKVAPPFKESEFDIMYKQGIGVWSDLVDLGVTYGIVDKAGSWFNLGDTQLGQGRPAAAQYFADNQKIAESVKSQVIQKYIEQNPTTVKAPIEDENNETEDQEASE